MARVILDEFVAKHEKALIYAGAHHSFTRYRQPIYDTKAKTVTGYRNRAGNIVYAKIGERAFNIYLHAPWFASDDFDRFIQPANGAVERIMGEAGLDRAAFDVRGAAIGSLATGPSWYSHGRDTLTLGDFCDGYIYQGPLRSFEGVTVDPLFITPNNLAEANQWLPNPRARNETQAELVENMRRDADWKWRFRDLK